MGSEESPSPSPELNKLITSLKSSMLPLDTNNITKALLASEQRLKNHNLELIKKTQLLEKENKNMKDLLKKRDKKIASLQRENGDLEDDVKDMVEEVEEMKKKVRVYEKRVLEFDVRVSGLEKLGKELRGSDDFSDKEKTHVLETRIQHRSSGKEESKQATDRKFSDTIRIDNDDDEDGLKYVPSSKRQRGSSGIKRESDSDDDRCISVLIKKPGTKEIPSKCNNGHANKIPTGTTKTPSRMPEIQTGIQKKTCHSVSPFLDSDSDSDEENIKEAHETIIVDKQKERRESADMRIESERSKKQIPSEKFGSQERTDKFPNMFLIDDAENKYENHQKAAVPALKRKLGSGNVKVEDTSEDERDISILRRKPVSKELQTDCKNDHANIVPTGGQVPFFVLGSAKVKVEEGYVPFIGKHTERWDTEAEMLIEFGKSYELCMNAVCALHRQKIPVKPRINQLAERLIDGDHERKLKKTHWELNRDELDQCRMLAITYSAELFEVYQKNADPFFPPRS